MSQSAATLPPAVFLMGPTASGKTALAIQLAHRFNAEIISVDSALVYRGMDIGVAKPNLEEREGIVHHLLDILDPSESYSTGQFKQDALRLMADITARGKLPLLVGGTMLYFNALLQGLADLPSADPEIRARLDDDLKQFGKAVMHQRLTAIDPVSAARIHPNDPQRVQRALEVFAMTGKTLTEYFRDADMQTIPYRVIKLIIAPSDRKILHEIIAQRFKLMLQQGLVDEVQKLYRRGDLHSGLPSMRAVGYRQVWDYLAGHEDYASMTDKAIFATRQLAKRQFTWLRRETEVHHLETGHADLWMNASKIVQQKLIC